VQRLNGKMMQIFIGKFILEICCLCTEESLLSLLLTKKLHSHFMKYQSSWLFSVMIQITERIWKHLIGIMKEGTMIWVYLGEYLLGRQH
jgi:hypothetical protein